MTSITLPRSKSAQGIAYYQTGKKHSTPIVLIHGVGLRAESWFRQIEVLSQNHTVYAIDMPGHGESDAFPEQQPDLNRYVGRIAEFITDIINKPVIVMGHSMGAMITLRLAEKHPGLCQGIAALNAVCQRTEQATQAVKTRAAAMQESITPQMLTAPTQRWFGEQPQGFEQEMAELCYQWLSGADTKGYASAYAVFAHEDGPSDAALANLKIPALFLTGDGDENSSAAMSRSMAERTPQGEAVVIKNSRHMVQLTHPEAVNQVLINLIKRCEIQGA